MQTFLYVCNLLTHLLAGLCPSFLNCFADIDKPLIHIQYRFKNVSTHNVSSIVSVFVKKFLALSDPYMISMSNIFCMAEELMIIFKRATTLTDFTPDVISMFELKYVIVRRVLLTELCKLSLFCLRKRFLG